MRHHCIHLGAVLILAAASGTVYAQPLFAPVDAQNHWSWQENCGWMNWRGAGAPQGSQETLAYTYWFGGFIWCENIGWINLGDGNPGTPTGYSNANAGDFGVNLHLPFSNNELEGWAWGENVGWINFGPFPTLTAAQRARLDNVYQFGEATVRMHGYAWGENIGWINLDDSALFVQFNRCDSIDFNTDAIFPDIQDIADFIAVFGGGVCAGQSPGSIPCNTDIDYNNDTLFPDVQDINTLLSVFAGGPCL